MAFTGLNQDALHIEVFDRSFVRQGEAILTGADLTPTYNKTGTGSFSINSGDRLNAACTTPGARAVVTFRDSQTMSGPIRQQGLGVKPADVSTYSLEDDWRVFDNTAAYVVPVAAYFSQGLLDAQSLSDDAQAISTVAHAAGVNAGYGAYVWANATTISAETAIKKLIGDNLVTRLGAAWQAARGLSYVPFALAGDQGRGGLPGPAGMLPVLRMDPIGSGVAALLTWSGLRLRAWQDSAARLVRIETDLPAVSTRALTFDSGILADGSGSAQGPALTRAIVGGPGDGTARAWHSKIDGTGLEALWGDVIEGVVDAGSVATPWASSVATANQVEKYFALQTGNAASDIAAFSAALDAAGVQALADGVPKSGLGVTLAETASFHFGGSDGVQLGDVLTVQLASGTRVGSTRVPPVKIAAPVTSAHITLDDENGVQSTPIVGERTDDPDVQLAQAIAAVQTALRRRASRK